MSNEQLPNLNATASKEYALESSVDASPMGKSAGVGKLPGGDKSKELFDENLSQGEE